MKAGAEASVAGRPRAFCRDTALAAALRVFWTKGYGGASLTDLTAAMGINRPSLYATFGNKAALFRQALDLYETGTMACFAAALEAPSARAVAERILLSALEAQTGEPKGCLRVNHLVACGDGGEPARVEVAARLARAEAALVARFESAALDGDLPEGLNPRGLARYLTALMQGMAVQAGGGARRSELEGLVDTALRAWPTR